MRTEWLVVAALVAASPGGGKQEQEGPPASRRPRPAAEWAGTPAPGMQDGVVESVLR